MAKKKGPAGVRASRLRATGGRQPQAVAYFAEIISALRKRRAIIFRIILRRISSRALIRPAPSTTDMPKVGKPGCRVVFILSSMRRSRVLFGQFGREGAKPEEKAQVGFGGAAAKSPVGHNSPPRFTLCGHLNEARSGG